MLKIVAPVWKKWKEKNLSCVSLEFVSKGCEGTTIVVHEDIQSDWYILLFEESGIAIYADPEKQSLLENATLSQGGEKWILAHEDILTRCGCGKSFSLKSGNIREDKIKLLKSKLAKKWAHH